jgi:RimJ/RimL family protein N-acetyltransferase
MVSSLIRLMLYGLVYLPRFTRRRVELHTPRLLLREWEPEDWKEVYAYRSDPLVRKYDLTPEESEEEVERRIRQRHAFRMIYPDPNFDFALVHKTEGRIIGEIDLCPHPFRRSATMGYFLHYDYWNQGYVTEAASAMLDWGFRELKFATVISMCHPDNVGSWRVMEKVGMTRQDRRPKLKFRDGSIIESLEYRISREDWLRRTASPGKYEAETVRERNRSQPDG